MGNAHGAEELGLCVHGLACQAGARGHYQGILPRIWPYLDKIKSDPISSSPPFTILRMSFSSSDSQRIPLPVKSGFTPFTFWGMVNSGGTAACLHSKFYQNDRLCADCISIDVMRQWTVGPITIDQNFGPKQTSAKAAWCACGRC